MMILVRLRFGDILSHVPNNLGSNIVENVLVIPNISLFSRNELGNRQKFPSIVSDSR